MHLSAQLPKLASLVYYYLWPKLRPKGYQGRLTKTFLGRTGLEWESREQVQTRQVDKVNSLISHAVKHVPYYRKLADEGRMPIRIETLADMEQIPILTKEIIRSEGKNLLTEGYPKHQLRKLATGGSTGQPVHFYSDEEALLHKNAAESWSAGMTGLKRTSSVAMLWGAGHFEPTSSQAFREKIELLITNRMFIDCFNMSEADLERAHKRLTLFQPEGLLGYTSALVRLARFLQDRGIQPNYPRTAVISAAETLDEVSRDILNHNFNAPVFNRYGSREMGLVAVECDHHSGLHIDCENVVVELTQGPPDTSLQQILVTKLTQFSMPFIRYEIGDMAEGAITECECGRGYPVLKRVVGRVTEMIWFPDGACLPGELFPHLLKDCGVVEYQVVQANNFDVTLYLVKAKEHNDTHDTHMRRVITQYLGDKVKVFYDYVDRIERSATGKLLPVISKVNHLRNVK